MARQAYFRREPRRERIWAPSRGSAELEGADLPGVEVEVEGAVGGGEGRAWVAEEVAGASPGELAADGGCAGVGVLADQPQLEPAAAAPQRRQGGTAVAGDPEAGDRPQRSLRPAAPGGDQLVPVAFRVPSDPGIGPRSPVRKDRDGGAHRADALRVRDLHLRTGRLDP